MSWRALDHTADAALEIEGTSFTDLLSESTRAFGEWLANGRVPADAHETERALSVRGADRVETWVNYWRALLALWTVEGFLPLHARVESSPDGLAARARVGCASAGALDLAHCQDVKAVTWHAARVEERAGRWIGAIVLDL